VIALVNMGIIADVSDSQSRSVYGRSLCVRILCLISFSTLFSQKSSGSCQENREYGRGDPSR
jgi:hypothetical protein